MKVYENIDRLNIPESEKQELKKHIANLASLRRRCDLTDIYVSRYLQTDKLYRDYCDDIIIFGQNAIGAVVDGQLLSEIDSEPNGFKQQDGSLRVDAAERMRGIIISVIEDDRFSFGYLYQNLWTEQNRKGGYIHDCVADKSKVEYAVDFDVDELKNNISNIESLNSRLEYINSKIIESITAPYSGVLKETFNQICNFYRLATLDKIQLQNKQGVGLNITQTQEPKNIEPAFGMNYSNDQLAQIYSAVKDDIKGTSQNIFVDILSGKSDQRINWTGRESDLHRFILYFADYVIKGAATGVRGCRKNDKNEDTQPGANTIGRYFFLRNKLIKKLNKAKSVFSIKYDHIFEEINKIS